MIENSTNSDADQKSSDDEPEVIDADQK